MEQYIKIKAIDEDDNLLGTFKVSIDYNGFINLPTDIINKEIPLGNLILYSIGVVLSIFIVCNLIDQLRIVTLEKWFFRWYDNKLSAKADRQSCFAFRIIFI